MEMKEFKEMADKFVVKCELEVETLKNGVNEVTGNSKNQQLNATFLFDLVYHNIAYSFMSFRIKLNFQ
jgi:hypothetical protein